MTKTVQANANLQLAHEIRRQGFHSLLDAQPEMRQRFIELRASGRTVKNIRLILMKEFPGGVVPSRAALHNFINSNLKQEVVVEPYLPDYNKLLRKLDPIQEMAKAVGEAKRQYEKSVKGNMSLNTQSKLLGQYHKMLGEYQTMLDRKGITRGATADNIALHQHTHFHQNNATNGQNGSQDPHETSNDGHESATNGHEGSRNATRIFAAVERLRAQAAGVASQGATE